MILATPSLPQEGLTPGGWTVMIGCIALVCTLVVFCFYRLLRESRPTQHHRAPLDIDTRDHEG